MTGYHPPPSPVTPKDRGLPSTDPHHDEALALGRADHSPVSAFVALALAVASLALLWFGRSLLVPAICLAVAAIIASVLAWTMARRSHRPAGVAFAALAIGVVVSAIVLVLWL
jgi:hypothetical protein